MAFFSLYQLFSTDSTIWRNSNFVLVELKKNIVPASLPNQPKNNKSIIFIWVFSVLGIHKFEAVLNQSVTLALLKCHLWALVSLSFQSYDVTFTFKSRVCCDSKDTSPTSGFYLQIYTIKIFQSCEQQNVLLLQKYQVDMI